MNSPLEGKSDVARIEIANRVGTYLSREELAAPDRRAAEMLARVLADDALERVRSALSEAIRYARYLPRDLALRIAHDVDSVSCPFLEVTDVFSDNDWQQLLLTISRAGRAAVARRSEMSDMLAAALAELGDAVVADALVENAAAPMTKRVCHALMDRFSAEVWILEKLATRSDLLTEIAITLTGKVSAAMREKLIETYGLPDHTTLLADEAETGAVLQIVRKTDKTDLVELARKLEMEGRLTPAMILKALKEGEVAFAEHGLSVRSNRSAEHVRSVLRRAGPDTVKKLLASAKIPEHLRDALHEGVLVARCRHPAGR